MSTIDDIEFEQNLNNFKSAEDLKFYIEHLEDEVEELQSQVKIEKFKLNLDLLKIEQGKRELDREKVILQMKEDGSVLEYVGSKFQNDYDVVIEAVKSYEWALSYASKELRDDYEVVYQALLVNPNAIAFASEELKKHKDLIALYINHWVGENKFYKSIDEFMELHDSVISKELISL